MTTTADNNAIPLFVYSFIFFMTYTPRKKPGTRSKMVPRAVKNPLSHQKNPIHPQNFFRVLLLYFFESFMAPVCRGYSPLYPATIPPPTKCNPLQ